MLKWFRISLAVEVAVLLVSGGAVAWYLWHGGEVSARMSAKSTRYARSHDELLSRQTLRYTSDIHHPSTLQSENRVSLFGWLVRLESLDFYFDFEEATFMPGISSSMTPDAA